jgi:hypothetical protein
MKHVLLIAGLLAGAVSPALAQAPGAPIPRYATKSGAIYRTGEVIQLVAGTGQGGTFKYVYIPPNAWLGFPRQPLGAKWTNKQLVIKELRQQPPTSDSSARADSGGTKHEGLGYERRLGRSGSRRGDSASNCQCSRRVAQAQAIA